MTTDHPPLEERRRGGERRHRERRRGGRPAVGEDPTALSVRVPSVLVDRLCAAARRRGENPSQTHRALLSFALSVEEASDGVL